MSDNRLARDERIKDLLVCIVNWQVDDSDLPEKLSKKFPDLIPAPDLLQQVVAGGFQFPKDDRPMNHRQRVESGFQALRTVLRKAWPEAERHGPCLELMDWVAIYWLLWRQNVSAWEKAPGDSVAQAAADFSRTMYEVFFAAQDAQDYMRFCANKDCVTRCFVKTRRRQEYCSLQCAAEGTKEAKRKWWIEEGRKKRRKATKRKRQPVAVRKTQKGR